MTLNVRGRVQGGRRVVDESAALPDGSDSVLSVVEDGDDLDDEDRARLHEALRRSDDEFHTGDAVPAADVLDRLGKR